MNGWEIIQVTIPELLKGMKITLEIFGVTLLLAIPLGFLVSLLRISKIKAVQWLTAAYIWVLRGTPLMLQLFFVYYGLPYISIFGMKLAFDPLPATLIAFVLNYSAYFAEIFRSGIESIDRGQYEGAKALGLSSWQTMRTIIVPQMVRVVLPPVSNETITLVKDTALASTLALVEMMRAAQLKVSTTASAVPFLGAAVFYLLLTLVLTIIFSRLEKAVCKY